MNRKIGSREFWRTAAAAAASQRLKTHIQLGALIQFGLLNIYKSIFVRSLFAYFYMVILLRLPCHKHWFYFRLSPEIESNAVARAKDGHGKKSLFILSIYLCAVMGLCWCVSRLAVRAVAFLFLRIQNKRYRFASNWHEIPNCIVLIWSYLYALAS